MSFIDHGFGVLEFPNAVSLNVDSVDSWVERRRAVCLKDFVEQPDGSFVHASGKVFSDEDMVRPPWRLFWLHADISDEDQLFLDGLNSAMADCVRLYSSVFPEVRKSVWWSSPPHVATYTRGCSMKFHHDNQVGRRSDLTCSVVNAQEFRPIFNVLTGAIVLKSECEGGKLGFRYPDKHFDPVAGSAFVYPSGFLGTHEVQPVISGERIVFLQFFGHGVLNQGSEEFSF